MSDPTTDTNADTAAETVVLSLESDAAPAEAETASAAPLRARTRWAGIVWGLVFAGLAAAGLWLTASDGRADDLAAWISGLDVATAVGYGLLAVGALVLVTGLVGLLRRAQRAIAARSTGA
ncbi:hypothetical protein [Microbacterium telephonicum]|uniref:Uncharacterized protein n=1 Tax=Microbacterium telephonicum TaxID=1714841 RepID=A0A498C077_9MICO|nr:hypothetical protein [Microbacterium telephonicum]RLK47886.1 hypothetical protein C7474_2485 [Microbacterium telephonicum]